MPIHNDPSGAAAREVIVVRSNSGVFELLGNGPGLSGAGDGIAAKGEDEGVSHGWLALPRKSLGEGRSLFNAETQRTQRKAQRKPWRTGARKSPSFARIGRLKPAPPRLAVMGVGIRWRGRPW